MTDLHNKSESELQELLDHAAKILKEKQDTRRRDAITQIQEIAGAAGITVTIKEERKKKNDPSSATEKVYQHPDKPDVTWSGNGAIPKWLKDLIKSGRDKAEFEIIHPAS
ncbi:MAG: H-NS histone family protein [Methylococcaceae bacterium]|nr:MAG: H-NS histone family protein [Methylococcaceae bacterium]